MQNLKVQYSPSKSHSLAILLNPGAPERIQLSLKDATLLIGSQVTSVLKVDAIRNGILGRKMEDIRARFERHCSGHGESAHLEIGLKGFQDFVKDLFSIKERQWLARAVGGREVWQAPAALAPLVVLASPSARDDRRGVGVAPDLGFASVADVLFAAIESPELVETLQRGLGVHRASGAVAAAVADAINGSIVPTEPPRAPRPAAGEDEDEEDDEGEGEGEGEARGEEGRRASAPMLAALTTEHVGNNKSADGGASLLHGSGGAGEEESLCGLAPRRSGYDMHGRARAGQQHHQQRPRSASPMLQLAGTGSRAAAALRAPSASPGKRGALGPEDAQLFHLPPSAFAVTPEYPQKSPLPPPSPVRPSSSAATAAPRRHSGPAAPILLSLH
eukprot:tig00020944_g16370.t1